MKLVSYRTGQGVSWGVSTVVSGLQAVVDVSQLDLEASMTLQEFIEICGKDSAILTRTVALAALATPTPLALEALLPAIPRPGKIICLGVNYVDHAKEGGNTIADYPTLFLRCSTSLLAHGAPLLVPTISDKLDYEAELALVIGKRTRFVSEQQALESVFAYACFNDATLRDYQRRTTQWTIGKNFDGTGAFGPCLVTADELPQGAAGLRIESRLNGKVMQHANTSDMVFPVAKTISLLSECMTLEAGDVIVMGTPAGVGYARTPPLWMKAGDTIEIEIEGIGILSNPVQATIAS